MIDVEFIDGEPPNGAFRRGQRAKWPNHLAPLMERPGVWAIVAEKQTASSASVAATYLRSGRFKVPPGRWEFVSRTIEGRFLVYACYLGEEA